MRTRSHNHSRHGFTLIEMMVAMIIGAVLILGMGTVLVVMFTGMRESSDFADATGRVDLVRQLTFDARTGNRIIFPVNDGDSGYLNIGGHEGEQVMFNSLRYDPGTDTTSDVTITWESRRPSGSPVGTPYTVYRFEDTTPETPIPDPTNDLQTFGQSGITEFTITRNSADSFSAEFETEQASETVAVQLSVTLRNVVD